jgi:hypothetical protein
LLAGAIGELGIGARRAQPGARVLESVFGWWRASPLPERLVRACRKWWFAMMKMMMEMRDRMKSRVGIYGTGWQSSSVMGLLLPFVVVLLLALVGYMFIHTLQSL